MVFDFSSHREWKVAILTEERQFRIAINVWGWERLRIGLKIQKTTRETLWCSFWAVFTVTCQSERSAYPGHMKTQQAYRWIRKKQTFSRGRKWLSKVFGFYGLITLERLDPNWRKGGTIIQKIENCCVIKSHTVSTNYFQFLLKLVINQDEFILISLLHKNNGRWFAAYRDDLEREWAPVNQRQTMGDKKTRPTYAMLLFWLRIFFW